jgi:hypothetical protein
MLHGVMAIFIVKDQSETRDCEEERRSNLPDQPDTAFHSVSRFVFDRCFSSLEIKQALLYTSSNETFSCSAELEQVWLWRSLDRNVLSGQARQPFKSF